MSIALLRGGPNGTVNGHGIENDAAEKISTVKDAVEYIEKQKAA